MKTSKISRAQLLRVVLSKGSRGIIRSQDHNDLIDIADELGVDPNDLTMSDIEEVLREHSDDYYAYSVSVNDEEVSTAIYRVTDPETGRKRYVAVLSHSTKADESVEIYAVDAPRQVLDVVESFLSDVRRSTRNRKLMAKIGQLEEKIRSHIRSAEEEAELELA